MYQLKIRYSGKLTCSLVFVFLLEKRIASVRTVTDKMLRAKGGRIFWLFSTFEFCLSLAVVSSAENDWMGFLLTRPLELILMYAGNMQNLLVENGVYGPLTQRGFHGSIFDFLACQVCHEQ